jgi:hypothetical protein
MDMVSRQEMLHRVARWFDTGELQTVLRRRVAHRTDSQERDSVSRLAHYLGAEIGPSLTRLGFTWRLIDRS